MGFLSTEPLWKDLVFRKSRGSIIIHGVDETRNKLVFEVRNLYIFTVTK